MKLTINQRVHDLPDELVDPQMPLLWALRDVAGLTGTKYSCGKGFCGACTVIVGKDVKQSCRFRLEEVEGRAIRTIEGLQSGPAPHALQAAWIEHQVAQCGYCQSGMLMAAAALLERNPRPTDADIEAAMWNLCRCGTYPRVRAAIKAAAAALRGEKQASPAPRPQL